MATGRQGDTHPEGSESRGKATKRKGDKTEFFCCLFSAFCLLLPLLLVSCAGQQVKDEGDLRRRLQESERFQAELRNRLDELQNRFEMLEIRVKEIQNRLNKLDAKGVMEEALPEPPLAADKKMREQDIIMPSSSALAPAPSPGSRGPEPPAKAPEKIEISAVGLTEPQILYDEAFRNYRAGNTQRARSLFGDFARRFPQDRLAPNAFYWLGECFYDQRNYPEALANFQKVVDLYPRSLKVPDALYKKGVCYLDQKQEERAAEEFRAVLNKYPQSETAKLAQEKLSKLAKGQP